MSDEWNGFGGGGEVSGKGTLIMTKIAIILGAGATRGSGYELKLPDCKISIPVDKDFLKVVFDNKIYEMCLTDPSGEKLYGGRVALMYDSFISLMEDFRIIENGRIISDLGLEETWNTVVLNNKFVKQDLINLNVGTLKKNWENLIKSASDSPQIKKFKWADYFLRVLIQKVYGEMINSDELKEDTNRDSFYELFKLLNSLKLSSEEVSLLTFNYDLCLEESLSSFMRDKECFCYPNFDDNRNVNEYKAYRIFKLHGSLNWWHGFDGFIRLKEKEILKPISITENTYFEEGSFESWRKYQPAIIPPDFLKEEFFNEQGQERLHRHYMNLWKQAGITLAEANIVVIIGYSFPPADPLVKWLVRASRSGLFYREKASELKGVYFLTYCGSKTEETKEAIKLLFELEPEVYYEGFEKCLKDKHLEKWMGKVLRKSRTKS